MVFFTDQTIELGCVDKNAKIRYRIADTEMSLYYQEYDNPFPISSSTKLIAFAKKEGQEDSFRIDAKFLKIPKGRKITIKNAYASQYSAGGDVALIDFQRGGKNFRTGSWQGYEGVDLDAVIDLGKNTVVSKLTTGFLQDINAWIFMPEWVDYFVSPDGESFTKLGRVENQIAEDDWTVQTKDFSLRFKPQPARYIKVVAKNRGICPEGHKGAGYASWIFADEVVIK